jgi:hypothetical protein
MEQGDQVKIINDGCARFEQTGVVTHVRSAEEYMLPILVRHEDGRTLAYEARELEPVR